MKRTISTFLFGVFFIGSTLSFADSTLERLTKTVEKDRSNIEKIIELAEGVADRLIGGANLWAGGNQGFAREMTMRAGGFMMIERLEHTNDGAWGRSQYMSQTRKFDRRLKPGDVILFAHDSKYPFPKELEKDYLKTTIFFGTPVTGCPTITSSAKEFGVSPSIGQSLSGYIFSAELFAALSRRGKIPTIFQSVGEFGGFFRIDFHYWPQQFFYHPEEQQVPKIDRGLLTSRYTDQVISILNSVRISQMKKIQQAGQWVSSAILTGKSVSMYSMGHIFPSEITETEIGQLFSAGESDSGRPFGLAFIYDSNHQPVQPKLNDGDVVIHIGYQHYPEDLYDWVTKQRAKLIYVSLYSPEEKPQSLHIDPRWPWSDAAVKVDGLNIPILATSGLINSAIAWDIYLESKTLMHCDLPLSQPSSCSFTINSAQFK